MPFVKSGRLVVPGFRWLHWAGRAGWRDLARRGSCLSLPAMRIDKMTTKAQEAMRAAADLASRRGNPELYPEHLIREVLDQEGGVGGPLVQKAGADPAQILRLLDA